MAGSISLFSSWSGAQPTLARANYRLFRLSLGHLFGRTPILFLCLDVSSTEWQTLEVVQTSLSDLDKSGQVGGASSHS